jgi:type II secretory pathway pseudopilin PulG
MAEAMNRMSHMRAAFTQGELLVVVAVGLLLAAVGLPNFGRSSDTVRRMRCAANLQQIGAGVQVYANEFDEFVPVVNWPQGQNPWQTYSVGRVLPGTTNLTRGFMAQGLLYRVGLERAPQTFYCPGAPAPWNYSYSAAVGQTWPSTPVGSGDEQIRVGYNYFPQLRETEKLAGAVVARLVRTSVALETGGTLQLPAPRRFALNPQKSMATDLVQNMTVRSHPAGSQLAGVNALFADGAVSFQSAGRNSTNFSVSLWTDIGNNEFSFRRVLHGWQP